MQPWLDDACSLADAVRHGDVRSADAVEASLAAIAASRLNAVVHLDAEGARRQAAEVDRRVAAGDDPGPFAGVPLTFAAEGPMPSRVDGERVGRNNNGALTIPANITGYPAISVPAGLTPAGLPVGLQAYARRHEEALLLDLALAVECARPWPLVAPGAPV